MHRRAIFRRRGDAGDSGQHVSSATTAMISSISRRPSGSEQCGKALIFQVAAEQGADPRSRDPKRIAGGWRHRTARRYRRAVRAPRRARSRCGPAPARRHASRPNMRKTHGLTDVSLPGLAPGRGSAGHLCPAFAHAHFPGCFARLALQRPCRRGCRRHGFAPLTLN